MKTIYAIEKRKEKGSIKFQLYKNITNLNENKEGKTGSVTVRTGIICTSENISIVGKISIFNNFSEYSFRW